ncbi:hypothetical protein FACS189431_8970 [Alphaproteobacteria bacterium]|nr:hypothetical protein FACS189431_8970 [Alphaproteobacteria bacterium]
MKKTDIALVIFIAGISVVIAYFVAKAVIGDPGEQSATVRTAIPISATAEKPSTKIFNDDAINPTVEVVLVGEEGGSTETKPTPGTEDDTGGGTVQ